MFSQVSGVAMGTKMGHFEYLVVQQYNKPVPQYYKRYIDDIIGAIAMNYSQLLNFINFVHNFDPAVKFTFQISETSVTFLDMNISLKQGIFSASIHYKSTDSHSYLDYRSSQT